MPVMPSQEAQTGSEVQGQPGTGGREDEGNPTNEVLFPPTVDFSLEM